MKKTCYRMNLMGVLFLLVCSVASAEPPNGKKERAGGPPKTEKASPTEVAIIGTWINKDYDDEMRSGRVEYTSDKEGKLRYVASDRSDGSGAKYTGSVVFKKQWADEEGNRHARSTVTLDQGFAWDTLTRISADGKTLEVQSGVKEINPKGPRYSIYHKTTE